MYYCVNKTSYNKIKTLWHPFTPFLQEPLRNLKWKDVSSDDSKLLIIYLYHLRIFQCIKLKTNFLPLKIVI